jgi:DNA-binding NtrC family response regulator
MPSHIVTVPGTTDSSATTPAEQRRRILVFSPDPDLAQFLLLNLEEKFQILREHTLTNLQEAIQQAAPHLILLDLCTFPGDISRQLEILHRMASTIPVIVLRAYLTLPPEINKIIDQLAAEIFYKPVDVTLVTQAIEDRLK